MAQFGTEYSKRIVEASASLLSIASEVVGGSYFSALKLLAPLNLVKDVNFDAFKQELSDLDDGERVALEQAFILKLDLANKALQQKFVEGANAVNEAVDLVHSGLKVYADGKALVARFKTILGV